MNNPKHKYNPTTLYLLHNRLKQQQHPTVRPSFTNKKATRSITQFSKINKQTNYQLGHQRYNSSLKKVIVNKNNNFINYTTISTSDKIKNIQQILDYMLANTQTISQKQTYHTTLHDKLQNIQHQFQNFTYLMEQWKDIQLLDEIDLLVCGLVNTFKSIIGELIEQFSEESTRFIEHTSAQLKLIIKQYQHQIQNLKDKSNNNIHQMIKQFKIQLQTSKEKGVFVSKLMNQMQFSQLDFDSWVRNSKTYEQEVIYLDRKQQYAAKQIKQSLKLSSHQNYMPKILDHQFHQFKEINRPLYSMR